MFSTFQAANEYLETLIPKEYKPSETLKLERIKYLLTLLGDPHKKIKTVHVGGTSGKGSTAYYLSQLLTGQGYKVGLHTSPHIINLTERMQIDGKPIPDENFIESVNRVKPLVEKVGKDLGLDKPTYFETTVAIAFDYFAKEKVDIAVIEVGIGGKLDATNVIHPLISIITNVDLDHTEFLGDTVEKIAEDKSGIIKTGVPIISGAHKLAVKDIIAKKAKNNKSPIYLINDKFNFKIIKVDFSGVNFDFSWLNSGPSNFNISIPALFQVENASLALAAVQLLKGKNFKITDEKIFDGLRTAKVPGRFEIVKKDPLIILDGAHNPAKVKTFLESLTRLVPNQKFLFLLAFKKDKDLEQMLELIIPYSEVLIITEFNKITDMGRHFTAPAEDIAKMLAKLKFSGELIIEKDSLKALEKAKKLTDKDHPLIITGSLYLIGELRNKFIPISN